jgi:hypothetical protein
MPLPAAPRSPVTPDGRPAFGAHVGHILHVRWSGLRAPYARPFVWRALHAKRWQYVSIAGPQVIAAVAIVDIGWAASAFVYLFDRVTRRLRADLSFMGVPRLMARVADGPLGRSTFIAPGVWLSLSPTRVRVRTPALTLRAELSSPPAPALCAIAPIDGGLANCTHKTVGLAVRGQADCGGARFDLDGHTAALDHTSGLLARDTRWRWASGADPRLGLNLVQGFNGPVENAFWIDGELHPAGAAEFLFDAQRPGRAPWRIRTLDGKVDLTFTPEGERRQDKNLIVAVSRYVQPFGSFAGVFRPPGRPEVTVRDLPGVTEDHVARW